MNDGRHQEPGSRPTGAANQANAGGPNPATVVGTDRLVGTPLSVADRPWLDQLHRDPEVMAYFGGIRVGEAQERWVTNHLRMFEEQGLGAWLFRERNADGIVDPKQLPVGRAALRPMSAEVGVDIMEIGYTVARAGWGRGLATEMAQAMVTLGFEHYGLTELGAIVHVDNAASQRVLAKVGFAAEPTHNVELSEGLHLYFTRVREDQ